MVASGRRMDLAEDRAVDLAEERRDATTVSVMDSALLILAGLDRVAVTAVAQVAMALDHLDLAVAQDR